ncbi:hypothetical protein [Benzoatithermus flavus]|uniref:Uncharacterized protein n=1 Tax=Benzoatithermus flavus TaxID=3108223 RepID=A0ABU8XNW7_9PROT
MARQLRMAVLLAGCLAPLPSAQAACTVEQIEHLLGLGFSHEQVLQLCAPSEPPSGQAASPADAGRFVSDLLVPEIGDDGTWKKEVHGDIYILQNKTDLGSHVFVMSKEPDPAWQSFEVEARFTHETADEGIVGVALVYGSEGQPDRRFLYNIEQDGTLKAIGIDGDNYVLIDSKQDPAFAGGDERFIRIGVAKDEQGTELVLDGTRTGLKIPYPVAAKGSVGIAAFGIGYFEFRNLTHREG